MAMVGARPINRLAALMGHRLALACYLAFALFPLYWLVKIAISPNKLLYKEGTALWPSQTTLANFSFVLLKSEFPRFFLNSVIVSLGTAVLVTLVAAGAGYAFSRFRFAGKPAVMFIMLLTQMFPIVMVIPPIYRLMAPLGLTDNLVGLIIVYTAFNTPFATFLMQSFFDGIPPDLEEAAMIDGCTKWQAFRRVLLPLAAPGVFTTAILTFIHSWNEFIIALSMINDPKIQTATVAISKFTGATEFQAPFGEQMAAGVIVTVPLVIMVLVFQRRIVEGLTAGASK